MLHQVWSLTEADIDVVRGKLAGPLQDAWGSVGRTGLPPFRTRCGDQPFLLPGGITPPPEGGTSRYLGTPLRKFIVLYTHSPYNVSCRKGVGVLL